MLFFFFYSYLLSIIVLGKLRSGIAQLGHVKKYAL